MEINHLFFVVKDCVTMLKPLKLITFSLLLKIVSLC